MIGNPQHAGATERLPAATTGFDSLQFREALGRFATGVCVITAQPPGHEPFGLTVNSFASLSLTPPLVLWCLQKDSHTVEAFRAARGYCVNVLGQEQRFYAERFARQGVHALRSDEYEAGIDGLPLLANVLARLECGIEARHDGGDHIILVGRVQRLDLPGSGKPLLYYAGSYHAVG